MKLELKMEREDGKLFEFKYDVQPDQILEFAQTIINDFSQALEITPDEMVGSMILGVQIAQDSLH